uniref:Weak toxin CM-1c n=1 Tax=Hemachatus haemachatus TaxID=8626 RepID=3SO61_HEMHA|nr:RecName: Full=Weak toxin CM-1c [Hemachatus haemachatus]
FTCFTTPSDTSETCPIGNNICYEKRWSGHGMQIEKGCVASCPSFESHYKFLLCCRIENCNQ